MSIEDGGGKVGICVLIVTGFSGLIVGLDGPLEGQQEVGTRGKGSIGASSTEEMVIDNHLI